MFELRWRMAFLVFEVLTRLLLKWAQGMKQGLCQMIGTSGSFGNIYGNSMSLIKSDISLEELAKTFCLPKRI